jgi:flavodoxin
MAGNRILVVFFSRTGTTRKIASLLTNMLGAQAEEIVACADRSGPFGYVRSLVEALEQRPAQIVGSTRDVSTYDLVVIGTPVWANSISSPVRAYLLANRSHFKNVAFFCSFARRSNRTALKQMRALAGVPALAECSLTAREARHSESSEILRDFVERLKRNLDALQMSQRDQPALGAEHSILQRIRSYRDEHSGAADGNRR